MRHPPNPRINPDLKFDPVTLSTNLILQPPDQDVSLDLVIILVILKIPEELLCATAVSCFEKETGKYANGFLYSFGPRNRIKRLETNEAVIQKGNKKK